MRWSIKSHPERCLLASISALGLVFLLAGAGQGCSDSGGGGPRTDGVASGTDGSKVADGAKGTEAGANVDGHGATGEKKPGSDGASGCTVFPSTNAWNTDISGYKVHSNSANFITTIGSSKGLHPDFGTVWNGAPIGIPYVSVGPSQAKITITYTDYGDESDPGPFPIPLTADIEGGSSSTGDRHVIAVDMTACMLYELYNAYPKTSSWEASSGARWDLTSNKTRTIGWTSADAAGLPIYPGLVRYDEVKAGAINHAIRFTVSKSQAGYILPATHYASSSTDANRAPMGLRLRLKASFSISSFSTDVQVILKAFKKYGIIVADNGSDWYISGAPNSSWDDSDLANLSKVKGSDFEVVDTGSIQTY
jgi:hypothetical protein